MGLDSVYAIYYDAISIYLESDDKKVNGKLNYKLLADMMNYYMEKIIMAGVDKKHAMELAGEFPNEEIEYKPRQLRGTERNEERSNLSDIARRTNIEYMIYRKDSAVWNSIKVRSYKTLCRIMNPEFKYTEQEKREIEEWNARVERLFGEKGIKNNELAEERSMLLKEHFAKCIDVFKQADKMLSPKLGANELSKNIWEIKYYSAFAGEAESKEFADKSVTDEVRQLFNDNKGYLVDCGSLYNAKIALMSNPLYGLIDLDVLQDYDTNKAQEQYRSELAKKHLDNKDVSNRDKAKEIFNNIDDDIAEGRASELEEEIAAFNKFMNTTNNPRVKLNYNDALVSYYRDATTFAQFTRNTYEYEFSNMKENFRFTDEKDTAKLGKYTSCFSEQPTDVGTNLGIRDGADAGAFDDNKMPVAFKKGERVMIVSTSKHPTKGAATISAPEELLNYSLKIQNRAYYTRLKAVDSTRLMLVNTVTKSPFNKLFRCMKRIDALEPVETGNKAALEHAEAEFKELKRLSHQYIEYKNDKTDYTDEETNRLETVKDLEQYADIRLKEIELVKEAKKTLEKYEELGDEKYKEYMKQQDFSLKVKEIRPQIDDSLSKAKEEIRKYTTLEPKLPGNLSTGIKQMESRLDEIVTKYNRASYNFNILETYMGLMVTAKLITKERSEVAAGNINEGKLEKAFKADTQFAYNNDYVARVGKDCVKLLKENLSQKGMRLDVEETILEIIKDLDTDKAMNLLPKDYVDKNVCLLETDYNKRLTAIGMKNLEESTEDIKDNAVIKEAHDRISELINYNFGYRREICGYLEMKETKRFKDLMGSNVLVKLAGSELRGANEVKPICTYVEKLGMQEVLECIENSEAFKKRYDRADKEKLYKDMVEPDKAELSALTLRVAKEIPALLSASLEKKKEIMKKEAMKKETMEKYESFKLEGLNAINEIVNFEAIETSVAYENYMEALAGTRGINFFEKGNAKDINSKITGDDMKAAIELVTYLTGMKAVSNDRAANPAAPKLDGLAHAPAEKFKETMLGCSAVKNVLKDMTYDGLYKFMTDKSVRDTVAKKAGEELVKPKINVRS